MQRDFPTTRWSLIVQGGAARSPDDPAVDLVARIYRPVLVLWLSRGGRIRREQAEDIVQSFFADKLNGDLRKLLTNADPKQGRFRALLASAMRRHVIDLRRAQQSTRRAPRDAAVLPLELLGDLEETNGQPIPMIFDRIWAENVVAEAVRLTRHECKRDDRAEIWGIFESRVLAPAMDGLPASSHEALAKQWNLRDANESSNLLTTGKRMFARNLRAVVSAYATDADEAAAEMDELWAVFSGRPRA